MKQITITFFQLLNDSPISEHSLPLALYSSDKLVHQITGFASRLTLYFNVELTLDSTDLLLLFTHKGVQKRAQLTPDDMPLGVPFQLQLKGQSNAKAVLRLMLDQKRNSLFESIQVSVISGKISSLVATSQQLMIRAVVGKQFNCSSCKSLKNEQVSWNFNFNFERRKQKNVYFQLWALSISDKRYFAYGIFSLDKQQTLTQIRLQNEAGRFVGSLKIRIQRNQAIKNINLHIDHVRLFNSHEINLFQVLVKAIRTEEDVSMESTRKQADYGDFNFRIVNEVLLQISLYNHHTLVGTFIHNISELLSAKVHTVQLRSFQALAASLHFRIGSSSDKSQSAISDSMTTDYIEINKKYQPSMIRQLQKKSPDLLPLPACLNGSVVVKQQVYTPQKQDILSKARKRMESFSKIYHNADQYKPSWQIVEPAPNYVPTWAQQRGARRSRQTADRKRPEFARSVQTSRESVKLARQHPFKQYSEDLKNPQRLISNANQSMPIFRPALKNNQPLFNKLSFQQTFQFSSHQHQQIPQGKLQQSKPVKLLSKQRRDSQLRQIVQQRQKIERIKEKERQQRQRSKQQQEEQNSKRTAQLLKKESRQIIQKKTHKLFRQQQQQQERRVSEKQEIASKGAPFSMFSKKGSQPSRLIRPNLPQSHSRYTQFYLLNKQDSIHQIAPAPRQDNQDSESAQQMRDLWKAAQVSKKQQNQTLKEKKPSKKDNEKAKIDSESRFAKDKRPRDSIATKDFKKSKDAHKELSEQSKRKKQRQQQQRQSKNQGPREQKKEIKAPIKKVTRESQTQQQDKKKSAKTDLPKLKAKPQNQRAKTVQHKQAQLQDSYSKSQDKIKPNIQNTLQATPQRNKSKGPQTHEVQGLNQPTDHQQLNQQDIGQSVPKASFRKPQVRTGESQKAEQVVVKAEEEEGDVKELQSQNQFISYHKLHEVQDQSQNLQVQRDMKTSFPSQSQPLNRKVNLPLKLATPKSYRPQSKLFLYDQLSGEGSPQRFDSFRKFMSAELAGPLLKGIKKLLRENPKNKIQRLGQILLGD